MPADLSLIMHATERDASKPAPERTRNRLPERCFPNPWRTDKAEDLSLAFLIQLTSSANKLLAQLAYGQELNDTLFDPFQPIMILIKNAARQLNIKSIVAAFCPGQSQHPIDIRAYHTKLSRLRGCAFQAINLFTHFDHNILRHLFLNQLGSQLIGL